MSKRKSIITIILIVTILSVILFFTFINLKPYIVGNNKKTDDKNIKYVFLFIGDGMDENHVELTEIYNNSIISENPNDQKKLSFSNFPYVGLRKNYNYSSYIPDSASSATAIASGIFTTSRKIKYRC